MGREYPEGKSVFAYPGLLINLNKETVEERKNKSIDVKEMYLGKGPTFYSTADENMFFKAIYSMPSYVQITGNGMDLYLSYSCTMTIEEKKFLEGLLKRYDMRIPSELKD